MAFFDTQLRLTPVPIETVEGAFSKVLEYIEGQLRLSWEEDEQYASKYAAARDRLQVLSAWDSLVGPTRELTDYAWLRLAGTAYIGGSRHGLKGFLYPNGKGEASFALDLSVTVYQSLYRFHPVYEGEIHERLARDLIGLCQSSADLLNAEAFLYGRAPDVLTPIPTQDLVRLMTSPNASLIKTFPIMLAGAKEAIVTSQAVETGWGAGHVSLSTLGYILLDLLKV
jgi:hypothetical protein